MPFSENVDFVGYDDLDGRSGFKLAIQERNGRFYLYVAALWHSGWSILDVTDPGTPKLVRWIDGPAGTWTLQVQVADGRMITNLERIPPGWGDAASSFSEGFYVWNVEDPEDPILLGHWRSGAIGTHRNFYSGGRYVHAATTLPGFEGHVYGIVDIDDPEHPTLVGRWWWPGQNQGAGEVFSSMETDKITGGRPSITAGQAFPAISLHAGPYVEGDRAYGAWMRAGLVILDVGSPSEPRLVSSLPVYPPLGSSIAMHTAIPLPERNLVLINSEALNERCQEPLNFAGIVDVRDEEDPVLISLFPLPQVPEGYSVASFCEKGGRFGPHNQHQPQGQPCLQTIGDYVYLTYFNAGLQIFDVRDPRNPLVAGYYIPDDPEERRGPLPTELVVQIEDVIVDRRGYVYVSEKNSGITILRFRG